MIQSLMRQVAAGQNRQPGYFPESNPTESFDIQSLMGGLNLNSGRPMDQLTGMGNVTDQRNFGEISQGFEQFANQSIAGTNLDGDINSQGFGVDFNMNYSPAYRQRSGNFGGNKRLSPTSFVKDRKNHERIMLEMSKTSAVYNGRTRFFIMKSFTSENLQLSRENGVWATTFPVTKRIQMAFRSVENVICFFSLNESHAFQGIARIESEPNSRLKPEIFANDRNQMMRNNRGGYEYENSHNRVSKNMKVEWLLGCNFPFKVIEDFPGNPLNEHMPITKSYNGQELPNHLGNYLSHLKQKQGLES